jgi:hypothetical protein
VKDVQKTMADIKSAYSAAAIAKSAETAVKAFQEAGQAGSGFVKEFTAMVQSPFIDLENYE